MMKRGERMQRLKLKRISWYVMVPVVLAVLVLFTVQYIRSEGRMNQYVKQTADMKEQLSSAEQSEATLRAKLANVSDPNTVDAATRAAYDFIKPGELRFEIENSDLLDNYTKQEWQILMDERKLGQY